MIIKSKKKIIKKIKCKTSKMSGGWFKIRWKGSKNKSFRKSGSYSPPFTNASHMKFHGDPNKKTTFGWEPQLPKEPPNFKSLAQTTYTLTPKEPHIEDPHMKFNKSQIGTYGWEPTHLQPSSYSPLKNFTKKHNNQTPNVLTPTVLKEDNQQIYKTEEPVPISVVKFLEKQAAKKKAESLKSLAPQGSTATVQNLTRENLLTRTQEIDFEKPVLSGNKVLENITSVNTDENPKSNIYVSAVNTANFERLSKAENQEKRNSLALKLKNLKNKYKKSEAVDVPEAAIHRKTNIKPPSKKKQNNYLLEQIKFIESQLESTPTPTKPFDPNYSFGNGS